MRERIITMIINKGQIIKELNKIALPLLLSSLTCVLMGLVDQAFVGHLTIYAYAGVGLVSSCINSLILTLAAMSLAFNIEGAKLKGQNATYQLEEETGNYIFLAFCIGSGLCLILIIFCKSILKMGFSLEGQALKEAVDYLLVYSFMIPLNLVNFIYSGLFKIYRQARYIFYAAVLGNIINLCLDYLLIFGNCGFPKMGSLGAALGSVVAVFICTCYLAFVLRKLVHIRPKYYLQKGKLQNICKTILPFWGQQVLEDILFVTALNAIIARLGTLTLATYTMLFQISKLVQLPMRSYSTANTTMVSEEVGSTKMMIIRTTQRCTLMLMVVWFSVLFSGLVFMKEHIISCITNDKELIKTACYYLPIALGIQIFNYIFVVFKSTLQALGKAPLVLKIAFLVNAGMLILILLMGRNLLTIYILLGVSFFINSLLLYVKVKRVLINR